MPGTKGTWPAVTEAEVIGARRLRLYLRYDRDPATMAWIDDLYTRFWMELAPTLRRFPVYLPDASASIAAAEMGADGALVDEYLTALRWEARNLGFDRIPRVGPGPEQKRADATYQRSGVAQVHALLLHLDKHRLWEAAPEQFRLSGEAFPKPSFAAMASFGAAIPAIDLQVGATGESWDPRLETFADARRRIQMATGLPVGDVERGLQAIVAAGDYHLPDTRTVVGGRNRLDRAATWTFMRLRHRWSYRVIAERWNERHPADFRLRPLDAAAGEWDVVHDGRDRLDDPAQPFDATKAIDQVRKAVREFATNAAVDVGTSAGHPKIDQ